MTLLHINENNKNKSKSILLTTVTGNTTIDLVPMSCFGSLSFCKIWTDKTYSRDLIYS